MDDIKEKKKLCIQLVGILNTHFRLSGESVFGVNELMRQFDHLNQAGLVDEILAKNAAACSAAGEIIKGPSFVEHPASSSVVQETELGRSVKDIKLMLWAIDRIGDLETAKIAWERCYAQLKPAKRRKK